MADIILDLDISELQGITDDLDEEVQDKLRNAARVLAFSTHAHLVEEANKHLHTRRDIFIKNLSVDSVSDDTWVITLKKEAVWVDEGLPARNMLSDLLASPHAKTIQHGPNKGGKYLIIPFKHDKGPTSSTPLEQDLNSALRKALKKQNIPYKKIERNPDGTPKLGLLHSFNLGVPVRKGRAMGLGEAGPKGRAYSAHSTGPGEAGPEGRPYLHGVRIYQRQVLDKEGRPTFTKNGQLAAKRGIFTFRMASSSQEGTNAWNHPGVPGKFLFDQAYEWALREWEEKVKAEIIRSML